MFRCVYNAVLGAFVLVSLGSASILMLTSCLFEHFFYHPDPFRITSTCLAIAVTVSAIAVQVYRITDNEPFFRNKNFNPFVYSGVAVSLSAIILAVFWICWFYNPENETDVSRGMLIYSVAAMFVTGAFQSISFMLYTTEYYWIEERKIKHSVAILYPGGDFVEADID